eukprot:TRINITY_DN22800_c0_g2_i1.p1 TRINITY_DN22800_c0_g2~~TRINITY_DN22800_c0_g2_i1.p1  ORF type:complete len:1004 (-),score=118.58 TRINITY_DN22800_c0_g2_i1:166-3177(-)
MLQTNVWMLVWVFLAERGESKCFVNGTQTTCTGFNGPRAANTSLTWLRHSSADDWSVLEHNMSRDHPDILMKLVDIDNELEFKTTVLDRSALQWKFGPDIITWWSSPLLDSFADDLMDLRDLLQETNLAAVLNAQSLKTCTGKDGAVYCAPFRSYVWWVMYIPSLFQKINMSLPSTFDELVKSCERLRAIDIIPIFLPSKSYWPASAFWDILNIRTNGADFHQSLSLGNVDFSDKRVLKTFENWQRLIDARCFQESTLEDGPNDPKTMELWKNKRIAMTFMGDFYRSTILSAGNDDDFDVFPFPTVSEDVTKGELVTSDALIVRKTTEHIRPVSLMVSKMLSVEAFKLVNRNGLFFQTRTDIELPEDRFREAGLEMLRSADMYMTAFDLVVPPNFFDDFKQTLVRWISTSRSRETIPELLRSFAAQRQLHFNRTNLPPTITPQSGSYTGTVEVILNLSKHMTQAGPEIKIMFSLNNEDITETYDKPVKLSSAGDHVIRAKVVGLPYSDSSVVRVEIDIAQPSDNTFIIVLAVTGSLVGCAFIFVIVRVVQNIVKLFAERQKFLLAQRLANQQSVINAYQTTKQLDFPMVLIRADRFLALRSLIPFETLVTSAKLIFLHSFPQVADFQLSKKILFLSHQWVGYFLPDPDNVQFVVMKNAVRQAVDMLDMEPDKVYLWIDYISIPQVSRTLQNMAIMSLVSYSSFCDLFIIVAPTCIHSDSESVCNADTYLQRGWCRAELFAKILTTGFERMFIARSDRDHLEPFGTDVDLSSLNVFHGDFTCCARKHKDMLRCDREQLQYAILGLYAQLLVSEKSDRRTKFPLGVANRVMAEVDKFFPKTFEFRRIGDNGEETEIRSLFGDRVEICQELVVSRHAQLVGDVADCARFHDVIGPNRSRIATMDRESWRALTWVPGRYRILSEVSPYVTENMDVELSPPQKFNRGTIVTILAVTEASIENAIIGQVEDPPGWIRLSTADLSIRWAEYVDDAFEMNSSCGSSEQLDI